MGKRRWDELGHRQKLIIANLIIWPFAWFARHSWLKDFAYRIDIGILPFIIAGLSAFIIAIATVSYQAFQAAMTNPVDALKYE